MFRNYNTYVNFINKMVLYVLTPIVSLMLLGALFQSKVFMGGKDTTMAEGLGVTMTVGSMLIAMGIAMVYMFMDHTSFGASLNRKSNFVEYVKSSSVGQSYFRKVVIGEAVIRIINYLVIMAALSLEIYIFAGKYIGKKEILKNMAMVILISWAVTSLIVAVNRHITSTQTAMIVGYIVTQVVMIGINLFMVLCRNNNIKFIINNIEILGVVFFMAIGILCNAFVIWKTNIAIKNWYIDEKK